MFKISTLLLFFSCFLYCMKYFVTVNSKPKCFIYLTLLLLKLVVCMICNFTPISGKQFMSLALDVTAWWNTIVLSVAAFMIVSWIVMIDRRTIFLLAYHSWEPGRKAKDYLHIRKDKFLLHGGKYTWLGESHKNLNIF